jgi:tetratricopeptide (TPR) repeat protein
MLYIIVIRSNRSLVRTGLVAPSPNATKPACRLAAAVPEWKVERARSPASAAWRSRRRAHSWPLAARSERGIGPSSTSARCSREPNSQMPNPSEIDTRERTTRDAAARLALAVTVPLAGKGFTVRRACITTLAVGVGLLLAALPAQGAPAAPPRSEDEPEEKVARSESTSAEEIERLIGRVVSRGGIEQADAVAELIDAGTDALEAVRAALSRAESETPPKSGAVNRALEKAATWIVAREILPVLERGLESQLTFDGQYTELSSWGKNGIDALLAIVDDSASEFEIRIAACRALADVGSAELAAPVRALQHDILLPHGIREQLEILLAVFGDLHGIENEMREYERFARDENLAVRISALTQLANLSYRIRRYEKAGEYYDEIISLYSDTLTRQKESGAPEQFLEALRRELDLHCYNAACSASLAGEIERAKTFLRRAVEGTPLHFENIEADGDLLRLREDPSYSEFRKELGRLVEDVEF